MGNNTKSKINKALFINLAAGIMSFIVQIIISFFLAPYIVAKLGEESYGFISLANNFVAYANLISGAINAMAQRHISIEFNQQKYKEASSYYSTIFAIDIVISVLITVVAAVVVVNLSSLINISSEIEGEVRITFILTFIDFIISLIGTTFRVATFCTNRMELDSLRQILVSIIQVVIVSVLYKVLLPKNYYLSIAVLVSSVFVFFINLYFTRKLTPELKIKTNLINIQKVAILVRDGAWIFVSNISNLLLTGVDLLVANWFIDAQAMGRLSISKQIPVAMGVLLTTLAAIFQASFTKHIAEGKKDELLSEVRFTLKLLAFMLTVPFAGIFVFGIDFLKLWLKARAFSDAEIFQIYVLMLLELINTIANAYMYSVHSLFIAYNKLKYYSVFILVGSILSFGSTLLLVANTGLGIYAVAGTSTIILAIINGILVPIYAAKVMEMKWNYVLKITWKSYLALIVVSVIFVLLKPIIMINSWAKFVIEIGICAIVGYLVSIILLLGKNERKQILGKIIRKQK